MTSQGDKGAAASGGSAPPTAEEGRPVPARVVPGKKPRPTPRARAVVGVLGDIGSALSLVFSVVTSLFSTSRAVPLLVAFVSIVSVVTLRATLVDDPVPPTTTIATVPDAVDGSGTTGSANDTMPPIGDDPGTAADGNGVADDLDGESGNTNPEGPTTAPTDPVPVGSSPSNQPTTTLKRGSATVPARPPAAVFSTSAVARDSDVLADLVLVADAGISSQSVEYHMATSSSSFAAFGIHTPSVVSQAEAVESVFLVGDQDADGIPDLFVLKPRATRLEVHVVSGRSGYQKYSLETTTPWSGAESATGIFRLCECDGDGRADLALVKAPKAAGAKLEVHVLTGASNYQAFDTEVVTPLNAADAANGAFAFGDTDGDGRAELAFIKTVNTATPNAEIHLLSGRDRYRSFILQRITGIAGTLAAHSVMQLAQVDDDGRADLVAVQTSGTGSGAVEVHAVSAASEYQTWVAQRVSAYQLADADLGTFHMVPD